MASELIGLELLKKVVENSVKNNTDKLFVLIHCVLMNKGFKCLGVGDSKVFDENEIGSELLPDGWNEKSPDNYNLRYLIDGELCLAKLTKSGDDALFVFIAVRNLRVYSFALSSVDLDNMDETKIVKMVQEELKGKKTAKKVDVELKFPHKGGNYNASRGLTKKNFYSPILQFPDVGRRDLDPFYGGGPSGMIFTGRSSDDARARPRFDPIHPLPNDLRTGSRRGYPDPDELPPPGNYFM